MMPKTMLQVGVQSSLQEMESKGLKTQPNLVIGVRIAKVTIVDCLKGKSPTRRVAKI